MGAVKLCLLNAYELIAQGDGKVELSALACLCCFSMLL